MALLLDQKPSLFSVPAELAVLHVAPERALQPLLRARFAHHVTLDLQRPDVDLCASLTALPFADRSCGAILCNHVLEHIEDEAQALRELWRVLKPGGWVLLSVPIAGEHTIEDPAIQSPKDRLRHYGQVDHVRQYGRDFSQRVSRHGFTVTELNADALRENDAVRRAALAEAAGSFFRAQRPVGEGTSQGENDS
jgi:SAM-dependent methyltransferase